MSRLVYAALAAGVVAEAARRARSRGPDVVPAQVAAAAVEQLQTIRVNPCGADRGSPADYSALYIAQKAALIRQFGSMPEAICPKGGFGVCVPLPFKAIPTASVACTLTVIAEWVRVARELAGPAVPAVELVANPTGWLGMPSFKIERPAAFGPLRDELLELADALELLAGLVRGIGASAGQDARLVGSVNQRVWSNLGRLAIDLQGVMIHHGNPEEEGRKELVDTLTSPSSYGEVALDAAGGLVGGVASILGPVAGRLLSSNLGAVAVVAGAGYLVWRST